MFNKLFGWGGNFHRNFLFHPVIRTNRKITKRNTFILWLVFFFFSYLYTTHTHTYAVHARALWQCIIIIIYTLLYARQLSTRVQWPHRVSRVYVATTENSISSIIYHEAEKKEVYKHDAASSGPLRAAWAPSRWVLHDCEYGEFGTPTAWYFDGKFDHTTMSTFQCIIIILLLC